jgi:two-component system, OmpR family, alkaline phosphatase synthesis response regulator PhoP
MAKTILVVDDTESLRTLVKSYLSQEGFRVLTAADGRQALFLARDEKPDLILLDLMMPEMDGYEFMRVYGREAETPIIMLTARIEENDRVLGLELGADDYVTKPFSIRELIARVKAFLRRQGADSACHEFGDCRLDLAAHKLFRKGAEVELTAKEFRLLQFFTKRAGRALTRDSILEAVWGNEVIVTDRSVDRCVTTLRSKIEPDPHEPRFIHTIRDIGYRFEDQP